MDAMHPPQFHNNKFDKKYLWQNWRQPSCWLAIYCLSKFFSGHPIVLLSFISRFAVVLRQLVSNTTEMQKKILTDWGRFFFISPSRKKENICWRKMERSCLKPSKESVYGKKWWFFFLQKRTLFTSRFFLQSSHIRHDLQLCDSESAAMPGKIEWVYPFQFFPALQSYCPLLSVFFTLVR